MSKKFFLILFCLFISFNLTFAQEKKFIINSSEIINEGTTLYDERKYKEAIEKLKEVDRNDTNYVLALSELSLAYISDSQYVEAVKVAEEGISYKTKHENHLLRSKGIALDKMGKTDDAIKIYKEALKKYPFDFVLRYNYALAQEAKSISEAISIYKEVLDLNPFHTSTHNRLANLASDQGKLVPYMLSSYMYLTLKPNSSNAFNIVNNIEKLVKGEINLTENKDKANYGFTDLETLIESKAALSSKYKHKVKLNYPFVSQTQLFLEKLEYNPSDSSIWMQRYVPFFIELNKKNYLEPFVYTMLSGLNIPDVNSWLKKNESKILEFSTWAANYISKDILKKKLEGKDQFVNVWYYENWWINAVGNYKDQQNKVMIGDWIFYHPNTLVAAEGKFDENGNKTGQWTYYYENGTTKEIENFVSGKSEGPYKYYHTNGAMQYEGIAHSGSIQRRI